MIHLDDVIRIFVISLTTCAERRKRIAVRLEELGLSFEFVDAVDLRGTEISRHPAYDSARRRLFFGRDLMPGELGCLLSHRKVYELIASRGISNALVLEDDAMLEDDLPEVLEALIHSRVAWDLVRFLDKQKVYRKKCRHIGMIDVIHELARLPTNSGGAYGYLLNQRAAMRLVKLMERNWLQNDVLHSRAWMTGLNVFIVRPSPVTHPVEDDDSMIGSERFKKGFELTGWRRVAHPFARFAMKLQDQVMKRLHYQKASFSDWRAREVLAKSCPRRD